MNMNPFIKHSSAYAKFWLVLLVFMSFSCSVNKKVDTGESAYDHKQYAKAIELLLEEYEDDNNSREAARKAYLLGSSYEILNNIVESKKWYRTATKTQYGESAQKGYARVLKMSGDYQGALAEWQELQKKFPSDNQIKREVQILKLASQWASENQSTVKIFEIESNTEHNDYAPQLYEGNYLVFTSDREDATGGESYPWTGRHYSDIFIMNKEGRGVKRFDAEINSNVNEGAACFTQDYNAVYFTRCQGAAEEDDSYCQLMYSVKNDGLWTAPQVVNFVAPNINYGQPALIEQDSVMIFCSAGGDGPGGYDLYYSQLIEGQTWSQPFPMPNTINTAGDEYFPTVWNDTLYFSSDYLPGLGGLDIFSTYLEDGKWTTPQNLMQPINSSYDDMSYIVDDYTKLRGTELRRGFFSSSRSKSGVDNIYAFVKYQATEQEEESETPESTESLEIYLAGKVVTNVYEDPEDPNSAIVGEQELPNAYVKIKEIETIELSANDQGLFVQSLEADKKYKVTVSRPGYLNASKIVSTEDIITENKTHTINESFKLDKIFYGQEIILSDIYYEFDKWNIVEEAKPTLDQLAKMMKDNPQIRMQLSSHTDCQGENDYNAILSQKRAQSAVRYLVDQGIPFDRLQAQGYGESRLALECECSSCTEEQHRQNRRTTFTVLK